MSNVHIYRPPETGFIAQTRREGCQKWHTVMRTKDRQRAASAIARRMLDPEWYGIKRGRVLATFEWHDPSVIIEMVKP